MQVPKNLFEECKKAYTRKLKQVVPARNDKFKRSTLDVLARRHFAQVAKTSFDLTHMTCELVR